ncbi:MAG TPA: class I SAM-dependent methyltransferase [Actinocatenispora sp.]
MTETATAWDDEYARGRYRHEPPVPFVDDILAAARAHHLTSGLYVGCGNGRNYLPLVAGGLDLTGLDISRTALDQLAERRPGARLHHGDLATLPPGGYDVVVGIQVFQHGTAAETRAHVRAAAERVAPGGLLCVRVNALGTDIWPAHDVIEDGDGRTVRYTAGPKSGLAIHFFAADELRAAVGPGFREILPLRRDSTVRPDPAHGRWCQWEAVWHRDVG